MGCQWNDIHHSKVLVDTNEDQRCRGRLQIHHDDDSAGHYEAARNEFAAGGYAATSIEAVARRAVSTKTLYRLIPNKVALLKSMVSDRLCHYAVYPIASESNPALVAFRGWLVEEAGRT